MPFLVYRSSLGHHTLATYINDTNFASTHFTTLTNGAVQNTTTIKKEFKPNGKDNSRKDKIPRAVDLEVWIL